MESEDGGFTEHELELARVAKEAFANHRFESCLSALNKLLEARRHDARVAHNRAVAQYLLSNLTLTDEFRKTLSSVNAQFDRDARSSSMDSGTSDKAVVLFNQALIHMRLRQYSRTTTLLEQLFRVNDALGDSLVAQVSLLLSEMYIQTYQLAKASTQVEFLECKLFEAPPPEAGGEESPLEEQCKQQLCLFRARLHLMTRNVKACKKELKSFVLIAGNTPCAQFLKANMEYLRHNNRKALKVLGSVPKSPIDTISGECLSAFYFNNVGCVHFQLGKYSLAAHYFHKALEENDAALNGFPSLDRATPLSGRPLAVLGVNCRHILLYNLAVQQLHAGHPLAAFDSLLEVVQVYHTNPRLWLRLAESCMAAHYKSRQEKVASRMNKSATVQMVFGAGLHRKVVLVPVQHWIERPTLDSAPQSAAMPAPTLEFASVCLRNALFLLHPPSRQSPDFPEAHDPPVVGTSPSPPTQGQGIISLRCSVLTCMAYVALGLGDPVSALAHTKQLLASPQLPRGLKFLGQLYAAEALVYLDRVGEAAELLNPEGMADMGTGPFSSAGEGNGEDGATPPPSGAQFMTRVRAVMLFNLASVFCVQREPERAKKALLQAVSLFGDEVPSQAILLSVYCEIMSGNTSAALEIIKKHQPFPHQLDQRKPKSSNQQSHGNGT